MKKEVISVGEDYTQTLPIFRDLILKSGARKKDNLIFAGCPGPCFSMATFFSSALGDLDLTQHFAADSDIDQLWRLDYMENLGITASRKVPPLKAKVLILMSGLCAIPVERTIAFIREALLAEGVIIGEAPAPGLFEAQGWAEKIPFHFLFEFTMKRPTSYKVINGDRSPD